MSSLASISMIGVSLFIVTIFGSVDISQKSFESENTETVSQEGMIGEIRLFAGNFAPRGWAMCDGQLLPVSQNQALFSILGTTFGGDGRTTFALPDLRGRVAVHPGTGTALQKVQLGSSFGQSQIKGQTVRAGEGSSRAICLPGASVNLNPPSLGVNYIICLQGIYPSRN